MPLSLEDFVDDTPWKPSMADGLDISPPDLIAGVRVQRLISHHDERGELTVLLTSLEDTSVAVPHVYHVVAKPRSIRAWVYHRRQSDRLAYVEGTFRLVLYDLCVNNQEQFEFADIEHEVDHLAGLTCIDWSPKTSAA